MRNIGIVTKTDKDIATVKVMRASACGENCASCKGGCSSNGTYIEAINNVNAKEGDKVVTYIPDNAALLAAAVAYVIPLLFAILPALVLYIVGHSEGSVLVAALTGFVVGALTARIISVKCRGRFAVSVIKIIASGE